MWPLYPFPIMRVILSPGVWSTRGILHNITRRQPLYQYTYRVFYNDTKRERERIAVRQYFAPYTDPLQLSLICIMIDGQTIRWVSLSCTNPSNCTLNQCAMTLSLVHWSSHSPTEQRDCYGHRGRSMNPTNISSSGKILLIFYFYQFDICPLILLKQSWLK